MPYTLISGTPPSSATRCLFCGKPTTDHSGFCRSCKRDGFDTVYFLTGRKSNGWDWHERNAELLASWDERRKHRIFVTAIWANSYRKRGSSAPAANHPWRIQAAV